jgi:phosphoserine phosphatase
MRAEVERPIPYGAGKVSALRSVIGARPILAACGDNAFDVDLLCAARLPLAVRPKERLLARRGEVPNFAILTP